MVLSDYDYIWIIWLVLICCRDLNENLQKSFNEYLEVRGIRPSMTEFLYNKYKYHKLGPRKNKDPTKNDEDYLKWLNELKTVIQAWWLYL